MPTNVYPINFSPEEQTPVETVGRTLHLIYPPYIKAITYGSAVGWQLYAYWDDGCPAAGIAFKFLWPADTYHVTGDLRTDNSGVTAVIIGMGYDGPQDPREVPLILDRDRCKDWAKYTYVHFNQGARCKMTDTLIDDQAALLKFEIDQIRRALAEHEAKLQEICSRRNV